MEQKIFAIYDSAAKAYLPPFFLPEVGLAIRGFTDAVNDPQTDFFKHPEDYTLFQIGKYFQSSGLLTAEKTPFPLAKALEVKNNFQNKLNPNVSELGSPYQPTDAEIEEITIEANQA